MVCHQVWLFPVLGFSCLIVTVGVSYGIAIANGHVYAWFPFISDTGAKSPESCIFGQLLNISAVLMGICVYLRHRQIVEYYKQIIKGRRAMSENLSRASMVLGLIACFGVSMVANFQESNVLVAHLVGALMAFYIGLIYAWTQTIFTFVMKPILAGRPIAFLRLVITAIGTAFLVTMQASGYTDTRSGNQTLPMKIEVSDPKYEKHLLATLSEWIMCFCFVLFFLTYAIELRHAALVSPQLILDQEQFETRGERIHVVDGQQHELTPTKYIYE